MKFSTLAVILYLSVSWATGQEIPVTQQIGSIDGCKGNVKIEIQQIVIKDTFLIRQINLLIKEEAAQNEMFKKGLGYVRLSVISNLSEVHLEDDEKEHVIRSYYIAPSLYSLQKDNELPYPAFYGYAAGRLICIYPAAFNESFCFRYSEKSKKRLRKRLEPFLEQPQDLQFYTLDGKKSFRDKKARIDHYKLHGGKYIYVFHDRDPKVVPDPYKTVRE